MSDVLSGQARNSAAKIAAALRSIALMGDETAAVVKQILAAHPSSQLTFIPGGVDEDDEGWAGLVSAFDDRWDDRSTSEVLRHYLAAEASGRKVEITSLARWVAAHPGAPALVAECMDLEPPREIVINRVLSGVGSQKLVFHGTWKQAQREVVVKRFRGAPEAVQPLIDRETHSHPLTTDHPNIIDSYVHLNASGQPFLIEEFLPHVLSDSWRAHGTQEAANLLFQVANALQYLHENKNLVHGDVKPDNIGMRGKSYVLMDFGICRPADEFTIDTTGTGSLRTRPPEVLIQDAYENDPYPVDVWALGATVFNALVGRFPLFAPNEVVPRIWEPERAEFESRLRDRAVNEWDKWVDLSLLPDSLRGLVASALEREPGNRLTARGLRDRAANELAAFLTADPESGAYRFSPIEELEQLATYLPRGGVLRRMPAARRHEVERKLVALRDTSGLTPEAKTRADELLTRLQAS